LQRQRRRALGDILDLHIHVQPVLMKPAQVGLGGSPAIAVFVQPRDGAVVHDFALLVAPAAVNHLSLRNLVDVASNDAVHKFGGIATGEQVLVERGDINQRSGIADCVVLVLMVHFVSADRVVSRPLAVVEALTKRESTFVKCGSDGHGFLGSLRTPDYTHDVVGRVQGGLRMLRVVAKKGGEGRIGSNLCG